MKIEQLKLKVAARPDLPCAQPVPIVRIRESEHPGRVVAALQEYFGTDDDRQCVGVIFDTGVNGFLLRSDLFDFTTETKRGLGDFDSGSLPGDPADVQFIRLKCPVGGCHEILLVTSFDATEAPKCPAHPGSQMNPLP